MSKLIQIREVPDRVHRTLKARAAMSGTSLSEYLRGELKRLADSPTPDELRARLARRDPVQASETSAEAVRALREETG